MRRSLVLAAVAAAALFGASAADAARVGWSIGIDVPPIAAVVGAPAYYPVREYYPAPSSPSYYAPAYPAAAYYPPQVVYAPRPRVWLPPLAPRFGFASGWQRDGWRDAGWRGDGRRGEGWRDDGGRGDDRRGQGDRHDGDRHERDDHDRREGGRR